MDLQAIEARLEAITETPWEERSEGIGEPWFVVHDSEYVAYVASLRSDQPADAEFIAHAPEDMRALIEEVGRLTVEHLEMRIERDDLRERRDYYRKALMKADGEIEAVKALHFPADLKLYAATVKVCATCEVHEWPCPTMLALGVKE